MTLPRFLTALLTTSSFAAALPACGGCGDDEVTLVAPAPETEPERRLLAIRTTVQTLANRPTLAGWKREIAALAKKTGLPASELEWRVGDLLRLYKTCMAVANADERPCNALRDVSVEAAEGCRSDTAVYGILAGRMVRTRRCDGDEAGRVAGLTHRDASLVTAACRSATGDKAACQDEICASWGRLAEAVLKTKRPMHYLRNEPILGAVAAGGNTSCDGSLVKAIEERLSHVVTRESGQTSRPSEPSTPATKGTNTR